MDTETKLQKTGQVRPAYSRAGDHYQQPAAPLPQDIRNAAPYEGQTWRVYQVDLNDYNRIASLTAKFEIETAFGLYPELGVTVVDARGNPYPQDGSIVVVARSREPLCTAHKNQS